VDWQEEKDGISPVGINPTLSYAAYFKQWSNTLAVREVEASTEVIQRILRASRSSSRLVHLISGRGIKRLGV
jgi:hypothetical protein